MTGRYFKHCYVLLVLMCQAKSMKANETRKLGLCALNSKFSPNFLELNSAPNLDPPTHLIKNTPSSKDTQTHTHFMAIRLCFQSPSMPFYFDPLILKI